MDDIMVPIVLFACVPASIWAVSHYRAKAHRQSADVMQAMVAKGEPVTPELIKALGTRPLRPHADLRTGIILVAIAIATILLGGAIPEEDGTRMMGGIAMFPLMVGLAYIAFWVFIGRKAARDN